MDRTVKRARSGSWRSRMAADWREARQIAGAAARSSLEGIALLVVLAAGVVAIVAMFGPVIWPGMPPAGRLIGFGLCVCAIGVTEAAKRSLERWFVKVTGGEPVARPKFSVRAVLHRLYQLAFYLLMVAAGLLIAAQAARSDAFMPAVEEVIDTLVRVSAFTGGRIAREVASLPAPFGALGLIFLASYPVYGVALAVREAFREGRG